MRNLFLRFRQGHIEEFWRPLWKWLSALSWPMPLELVDAPEDIVGSLAQRLAIEGAQQGLQHAVLEFP